MTGTQWRIPLGDTILTTGDIAKIMRVRPERVTQWCIRGRIECFRTPGGHHRIYASKFQEALQAGKIPPRKS